MKINGDDINLFNKYIEMRKNKNHQGYRLYPVSDDISGSDLDIPGTEIENKREDIGDEDKENSYYRLGGEDHNNLEVYKGE